MPDGTFREMEQERLGVRFPSRQSPLTKRKLCLKTHYGLQCSIQFFHCDRLDQMLGKTGFKASGRICLRPESAHRNSDKHVSRFCHQFHATSIGQADVADEHIKSVSFNFHER